MEKHIKKFNINGKDYYFKLSSNYHCLDLLACTKSGRLLKDGAIVSILESGYLARYKGISKKAGVELGREGKIVECR